MSPLSPRGVRGRTVEEPELSGMLREVRAGGAPSLREVVFTRNRRVMVSTGSGGRTLRLNERFRDAPPEVLRAVGCVLSGRPLPLRDAAKVTIVEFLRENPPPPRVARGRRVPRGDHAELERLRAEFERVNRLHFSGALPLVPIALSGRMRRRNGHFSAQPLEIVISRALCHGAEHGEAEKTLRHEMIHLWQHEQGQKPGHGADFRRWAEALEVHPRAARDVAWKCETARAVPHTRTNGNG